MVGLRTQENEKFNRFFALIQAEAEKKDSVFFADAGDGNEFATSTMEGEDMMGWLVPKEKVEEFEPLWEKDSIDDSWSDFFTWAVWTKDGEAIHVHFEG
ncbi:MAG: hypothetical protein E7320_02050 [Clostridiales bacterium]|nr:hypothetical protein [Clostridiales bacterium]